MLSMLLETRGYMVKVASSGEEAFNLVSDSTDLILLDLILPDQDGFDICRRFKETTNTRKIPIIILSARMLSGDVIEGLYLGADDYLTKPFECEELVARMEAVIRRGSIVAEEHPPGEQEIIDELRKIIDHRLITPFFQPIYLLEPFKIYGYEALTRPHTLTMLTNPEVLFQAALRYGFYESLEFIAWRKAIEYAVMKIKEEKLFLNCNPYLVESPKFVTVQSIFSENNINPEQMVLEITERSAITDFKVFYEHLKKYRDKGFKFAIDDVGGGFASLESVVETSPEFLKIDRHIITELHNNRFKKSIVKFIVDFCNENNIMSIAEGVETKEEYKAVKDLGVDAIQGFYLHKPSAYIDTNKMTEDAKKQILL